jgi:hypothetical protein
MSVLFWLRLRAERGCNHGAGTPPCSTNGGPALLFWQHNPMVGREERGSCAAVCS